MARREFNIDDTPWSRTTWNNANRPTEQGQAAGARLYELEKKTLQLQEKKEHNTYSFFLPGVQSVSHCKARAYLHLPSFQIRESHGTSKIQKGILNPNTRGRNEKERSKR